uniref:Uncharacterized protein n=1 Tax=Onchocerca volvulus TaxID=6282 RepID=A0A8R1TRM2_ONCVO
MNVTNIVNHLTDPHFCQNLHPNLLIRSCYDAYVPNPTQRSATPIQHNSTQPESTQPNRSQFGAAQLNSIQSSSVDLWKLILPTLQYSPRLTDGIWLLIDIILHDWEKFTTGGALKEYIRTVPTIVQQRLKSTLRQQLFDNSGPHE